MVHADRIYWQLHSHELSPLISKSLATSFKRCLTQDKISGDESLPQHPAPAPAIFTSCLTLIGPFKPSASFDSACKQRYLSTFELPEIVFYANNFGLLDLIVKC